MSEDRASLPTRLGLRQPLMAFMLAIATAAGGAVVSMLGNCSSGVVTNGRLAIALSSKAEAQQVAAINTALGAPKLRVDAPDPPPIYDWLRTLNIEDMAGRERVGLEIRTRVGLQVALYRALQAVPVAKGRRETVADIAAQADAAARAKFDEFVMNRTPLEAANKVLEEAQVPR